MSKVQAYRTIKKTLERERVMRVRVFRGDTKKLTEKTREIDDALVSLLRPVEDMVVQPNMFEGLV